MGGEATVPEAFRGQVPAQPAVTGGVAGAEVRGTGCAGPEQRAAAPVWPGEEDLLRHGFLLGLQGAAKRVPSWHPRPSRAVLWEELGGSVSHLLLVECWSACCWLPVRREKKNPSCHSAVKGELSILLV